MKRESKKRCWRFRGLCADAAALGVHRTHLYKVLSGDRPGRSLLARYSALKLSQKKWE
jgi:DNA-binding phage protein